MKSTFPLVPLGSICKQIRGVSYKGDEARSEASEGFTPVLRANNILSTGTISYDDLVFVPSARVQKSQLLNVGDIVVAASSGSLEVVGKASFLEKPWVGSFGAFCKTLRPDDSKVIPSYLRYYFHTRFYRHRISQLAAGANINNLRNEHLDNLEIPLPPLPEQRRIAAILDQADAIRRKRQKAIELTEKFLKSAFLEMFGDPVTNPKGWSTDRLDNLCQTTQGVQIPKSEQSSAPKSGYRRYLYISDLFSESELKFIRDSYPSKVVTTVDLIVANTGSPGRVFRGVEGILSNNLFRVSFDKKRLDFEYLYRLLSSQPFQEQLQSQMKQGIQRHLGHKTFGRQEVQVPPLAQQRRFASLCQKHVSAMGSYLCAKKLSEKLFNSLVQRAFRGELSPVEVP